MGSTIAAIQPAEGAPLELLPWDPPAGADPIVDVIAGSPGPWDACGPASWPRIAGGALAVRDSDGALWLCGGYLPCDRCLPCRSGLALACRQPIRPGWNAPGGLASAVRLPPGAAPGAMAEAGLPQVVALLGAAGLAYQAQASAGMAPGDSVVVVGDAGPGALPLRLLVACGLRPVWLDATEPPPEGVSASALLPDLAELPSSRCHLLDLTPTRASLRRWQPLAELCLSISLLGPPRTGLSVEIAGLLAGATCLRWIHDLHPHLVLDVAALVTSRGLALDDVVQAVPRADALPVLQRFQAGGAQRWPVLI